MCQKVETYTDFSMISQKGDAIGILKLIKDVAYNYQVQRYVPQALHEAKKQFYNCHQLRNQSIQAHFEYFQNQVDVITHVGGIIGNNLALISKIAKDLSKEVEELSDRDKDKAQDEFLATAFLNGADFSHCGRLLDRLQNDYLQGQDGYPKTLTNAYHLLTNWKTKSQQNNTNASDGVSSTTGSTNPSNNNRRVQ
jgi:hypothetical protein